MAHERACSTIPKVVAFAFRSFNSPFNVVFRPSPNSVINVSLSLDLQGDPENADQEEADEIDLDPDSDEADDFAECTSPYA